MVRNSMLVTTVASHWSSKSGRAWSSKGEWSLFIGTFGGKGGPQWRGREKWSAGKRGEEECGEI